MMSIKKETSELHDIAATLMMLPLCHIEGAYVSALYHTRKAISLSPKDMDIKEGLLFLHKIPGKLVSYAKTKDKLVSDKEAREVALEILKKNPDSIAAKSTLDPEKYC